MIWRTKGCQDSFYFIGKLGKLKDDLQKVFYLILLEKKSIFIYIILVLSVASVSIHTLPSLLMFQKKGLTRKTLTLTLAEGKYAKFTRVDHLWPHGKSPHIVYLTKHL